MCVSAKHWTPSACICERVGWYMTYEIWDLRHWLCNIIWPVDNCILHVNAKWDIHIVVNMLNIKHWARSIEHLSAEHNNHIIPVPCIDASKKKTKTKHTTFNRSTNFQNKKGKKMTERKDKTEKQQQPQRNKKKHEK